MKRDMFEINEKDKILIYGYPKYDSTKELLNYMVIQGWNICGVIDKRASLLQEKSTYPIWKLEEIPFSKELRKTIVVIVLLQNGFLHTVIANALWEQGFEKILFVPKDTSNIEKRRMSEKYNALLFRDFGVLKEIPIMGKALLDEIIMIDGLIKQEGNVYTVLVQTELLFSGRADSKLKEQNIKYCTEYLDLYDYLTGKKQTCQEYLWIACVEENKADEFLADRKRLYLFYEQKRVEGDSFFVDNAPRVVWNEKGYFNIVDGHHRAVYLAYCGQRKIPVQMTKADYLKWKNAVRYSDVIFSPYAGVDIKNEIVIDFVYNYYSRSENKIKFLDLSLKYVLFFQQCGWTESYVLCDSKEKKEMFEKYSKLYPESIRILSWDTVNKAKLDCAYFDLGVEEEKNLSKLFQETDIKEIILNVPLKKERQMKDMLFDVEEMQELGFCHFKEESVLYYLKR